MGRAVSIWTPWALLAGMAAGCSSEKTVYVDADWPLDRVALVLITDANDQPLEPAPRIVTDASSIRLTLAADVLFRVHVLLYAPVSEGGPDFDTCGAVYGGLGAPVPTPMKVLQTPIAAGKQIDELPLLEVVATANIPLRYARCSVPRYPCAELRLQPIIPGVRDVSLADIVAPGDDLLYYVVARITDTEVGKIENGAAEPTVVFPGAGQANSIAWDGANTLWIGTELGWVISTDLELVMTSSRSLGEAPVRVAAARDGTAAAFGTFGVVELSKTTGARTRLESLEGSVDMMALIAKNRAAAVHRGLISFFDGTTWRIEHEIGPSGVEEYSGLGGDADVLAAVGKYDVVLVREEARRAWRYASLTAGGSRLLDAVGLGEGRLLTAGAAGEAAILDEGGWCLLMTETGRDLRAVAVSPSGRVAYLAGEEIGSQTGDPPALLRLSLPLPR